MARMRITHNNPDLLVIDVRPWLMGVMLGGGTLIFLGAAIATAAVEPLVALGVVLGAALFALC